ncbi:MAG: hypothetical protein P0Y49_05095 [Candidatus Pedobacter colombiensis]|uniref:Uncharacterized protein n=1 Tax=Candidatus Pedobacter colombiensis TaxID=3121371 RepID=A0AAJ5W9I3_9SPHI|nr:hypothetical protein [Pedobacter sp.]WEK20512.1 MAG: hypothetical protein P0Y49_05095 [Pedobacter sp.]
MKERQLQEWLVKVVKTDYLINHITGLDRLKEATMIDDDSTIIPHFAIDRLLKQKYSYAASRVIKSLEGEFDLVSGEIIQNISLSNKERLLPDLILFNVEKRQVILVENKVNNKTEREAITELFGYGHEIRNHLPFLSNFDINYVLVSTDFNTLLDHSVSGQILTENMNILCLKPVIENEQILNLELHFPSSWSDIGQTELPEDALVGISMLLYEKTDFELTDFDYQTVLNIACDLVAQDSSQFNASGFLVLWKNGLVNANSTNVAGISIYTMNPFVFLPHAEKLGFPLNENSALRKYLVEFVGDRGTWQEPGSLYGIPKRAEMYLKEYFDIEWERSSTWIVDSEDYLYALNRCVLKWNSWGAVGDYVRNFYLRSNNWFKDVERKIKGGYQNPYLGLQIINYLAGTNVFKGGYFNSQQLFQFGLQIGRYRYACQNAKNAIGERLKSAEALLFWTALPLVYSLKEVGDRVVQSPSIAQCVAFPLAIHQIDIYEDYEMRIQKYIDWFQKDFIDAKTNPTVSIIFRLAIDDFPYFDNSLRGLVSTKEVKEIEVRLAFLVRTKILEIVLDRLKNRDNNKEILEDLNSAYFDGLLYTLKDGEISKHLDAIPDAVLSETFSYNFLGLLDSIKKGLLQDIGQPILPGSVDWNALYKSAILLFKAGERKTAIIISPNGETGLGKIDTIMSLNSQEEIFIQFNARNTWLEMTLKENWQKILDRTSHFFDNNSKP